MRTTRWTGIAVLLLVLAPARAGDPPAKGLYLHGDPTDDEQYILELINRARMDPRAEGQRVAADYGSNLVTQAVDFFLATVPNEPTREENRMRFARYPRRPPLAFNVSLIRAARKWSGAMRANDEQGPQPGLFTSMLLEGYDVRIGGQLINGRAQDPLYAHAAWMIDWGNQNFPGTNDLFAPNRRGLLNMANDPPLRWTEAGIGALAALPSNTSLGPLIVTVDLADSNFADRRFVTGVCYADLDGNGEYGPGEGRKDVVVDVEPSGFYTTTSASGGFAVPVARDAGDLRVTACLPAGSGDAILESATQLVTTKWLRSSGTNVKVDFLLDPRGAAPVFSAHDGATGPLATPGPVEFPITVPLIDAARDTVGDVDVEIAVTHPDRSALTVTLVSPRGTRVTLWDRGAAAPNLAGTFDTDLRPLEPLSAFVGEPYAGNWMLEVSDDSGAAAATLDSVRLLVRPGWTDPLHAPRSPLFVRTLRINDSKRTGKDKVTLDASFDLGRRLGSLPGDLVAFVLRDLQGNALYRHDLLPAPGKRRRGTSLSVDRKDTSAARVLARLKKLELPDLPRDLRVELLFRDAVVSEDVPVRRRLYRGLTTAPLGPLFRVDRLTSRPDKRGRRTVVRGRFHAPNGFGDTSGGVEIVVGDFRSRIPFDAFRNVLGRLEFAGSRGVRKFVIDPVNGTFRVRLGGVHDPAPAGITAVSLTIGEFHGDTHVAPRLDQDAALY